MGLRRLQITDFRCLRAVELHLDPRYTLISGPNASGKTSLLEAIYVLGRGRSFRARQLARLIRFGADRFVTFGETENPGRGRALGVEGTADRSRARIDGRDAASIAELAKHFPVQIIDPEVHKLIEEGPGGRRRFLDWGVFHVEPTFLAAWHRYRQALSQRNAALRAGQPDALVSAWNPELIRAGMEISAARARYVDRLSHRANPAVRRLLGAELELKYRHGWAEDLEFGEALSRSGLVDRQRAATQVGPHRAELMVCVDGGLARERVSRGQQKLLAAALLIAQLGLLPDRLAMRPTLLLDDPAAELDQSRLAALIAEVEEITPQLIVTTLQPEFPALGRPGSQVAALAGEFRVLS